MLLIDMQYTISTVSLKVFFGNITVLNTETFFLPVKFRKILSAFICNKHGVAAHAELTMTLFPLRVVNCLNVRCILLKGSHTLN
jgi:hypothetical protein